MWNDARETHRKKLLNSEYDAYIKTCREILISRQKECNEQSTVRQSYRDKAMAKNSTSVPASLRKYIVFVDHTST
jgi:hypothetical protein